eukprot:876265-Pleurochrysis_carterae.AAC.1
MVCVPGTFHQLPVSAYVAQLFSTLDSRDKGACQKLLHLSMLHHSARQLSSQLDCLSKVPLAAGHVSQLGIHVGVSKREETERRCRKLIGHYT